MIYRLALFWGIPLAASVFRYPRKGTGSPIHGKIQVGTRSESMAWTSCANFADHRRPDGSPCTQLLFRCVTRSAAALTRGQHLTRTSSSDQTLWLGHTELNPDRVIRFEDMGSSVKQMTQHFFRYRTIGIPCSSRTALSRKALEDGNLTWDRNTRWFSTTAVAPFQTGTIGQDRPEIHDEVGAYAAPNTSPPPDGPWAASSTRYFRGFSLWVSTPFGEHKSTIRMMTLDNQSREIPVAACGSFPQH